METILADVINHEWNLARDAGDSWPDAIAALTRPSTRSGPTSSGRTTIAGARRWVVHTRRPWPCSRSSRRLARRSTRSATGRPRSSRRRKLASTGWTISTTSSFPAASGWSSRMPKIFEHMLERFDLKASDVFFIDDNEPNVAKRSRDGHPRAPLSGGCRTSRGPHIRRIVGMSQNPQRSAVHRRGPYEPGSRYRQPTALAAVPSYPLGFSPVSQTAHTGRKRVCTGSGPWRSRPRPSHSS